MKIEIGMRNIKTALAIFLCVAISRLLHLEYPFYAAIAAIISMESSVSNSFKAGKTRMMGTFVGAAVGLVFSLIRPESALFSALGMIVVVFICNILNWNKSISIAGIVLMAIMVNLRGDTPLHYSLNRILDTFIGIGVAVLVNYLIFPPKHERKIVEAREALSEITAESVDRIVCKTMEADLKPLRNGIDALNGYLNVYMNEFRLGKKINDVIERLPDELETYKQIYAHLKIIRELGGECVLNSDNAERLKSLNYHASAAGETPRDDDLHIVYNYHVNRMTDHLNSLGLYNNMISRPHHMNLSETGRAEAAESFGE